MNEIQQRLALIDHQLAGRTLPSRLVSKAPLFFPAVGLMAGILAQSRLSENSTDPASSTGVWLWLILLLCIAAAVSVYFARSRQNPRPETLACGLLLCFACLGAIRLLAFERAVPHDIRHLVGRDRVLATVRGRILTRPYQARQDWCFAPFVYADPSSAFYLRLDQLKTAAGWEQVTGTIRVQVDEPTPNLKIGDSIRAYCWLHRFEGPTNPGQFNLARYLRLRNIYVGASVPAREAIEVGDDPPRDTSMSLRRRFTDAAARGLLDQPTSDTPGEALLEALLLGERRNIDRDTYEAFRQTGLLHLVSLSGMHLSILVLIVWWFCKVAGLTKPGRAVVCVLATAAFLLVVPPRGPTLRAAVIVWAFCAAILLRRRTSPLNSLSLAALILLLLRPTQLFEPGWQLSFAAVAGILALTPRIEDLIHAGAYNWFDSAEGGTSRSMRLVKGLGRVPVKLLAVGFAAWLGGAGILLYHFHSITPLASLWTVLAALPVTAILTLGFLKILLSFLLPTLSILLGHLLHLFAGLLIWMVKTMAQIDFSYILIGHVPLVLIVLYYILILFAGFASLRRPALKKGICAALALMLIVSLGVLKWQRTHRDHLSITCLDVGHGQALLARLPGRTNILFDAGSLYRDDVGTRIVVPFLDYMGIRRLHAVVVSHHDLDHINGIPETVDRRRIGCVYVDETSFPQTQRTATAELLMQHLTERHVDVAQLPRTITVGSTQVHALWPGAKAAALQGLSDNDKSLVCLVEFAGKRVVLGSDTEKLAQREILRLHPSLKADVVIAPHHGSTRTLEERFLRQLEPATLVCSCGRTDYERGRVAKPAPGSRRFVTARDGAITVCIDKTGVVETSTYVARPAPYASLRNAQSEPRTTDEGG